MTMEKARFKQLCGVAREVISLLMDKHKLSPEECGVVLGILEKSYVGAKQK